jgi:hypothetical protein
LPAAFGLTASSLPFGEQAEVAAEWLDRLNGAKPACLAEDLYCGSAFRIAHDVARGVDAPIFIVSAGLGLVAGRTRIPAYDLTLSTRENQSISKRMSNGFNRDLWWESVVGSAFSTTWAEVFAGDGLVLMAVSQGYAQLIAGGLEAVPRTQQRRLRLFGLGIEKALPGALIPQIMPYDERLDTVAPGTKTNFAARAMHHFCGTNHEMQDVDSDRAFVDRSLAKHRAPLVVHRPRVDDEQLIKRIGQHLRTTSGIQRILRRVRDEDRIACEQRRFTRLYHAAVERKTRRSVASQRSA